jgi:spore coat polysaccharide biosynthesis protein SpsF (cytidylyltransferase family)
MPEQAIDHVVDNLVSCAISLSAYNMVTDLNIKLSLIQQINKEYNALANKLINENISQHDLDVAAPVAKEKVTSEIQRRDDFGLHSEAMGKLAKSAPSRVDQIINFLKQNRNLEIHATLSFKEPTD